MKLLFFLVGVGLLVLAFRFYQVSFITHHYTDGEVIQGTFLLTSEPQIAGKTQRFNINIPHSRSVGVMTSLFPRFGYGDVLNIHGTVRVKVIEDTRTVVTMQFPEITRKEESQGVLSTTIGALRKRIHRVFVRALSPLQASLLEGIVFGIKQDMPETFLTTLRIEGLTHIIAASGMNISLVAGFLVVIFSYFLSRPHALIASIIGICGYSILAGLEPSILRAAIMAIIALSASLLGRQNYSMLSLIITAYIMLLYEPLNLFDVGFQLSFLATIGIIALKPVFDMIFFIHAPKFKNTMLVSDTTTTLAAQVTTLPILLTYFGTYNLLSIFTNLCVLWTIPLLMILGGFAAIVGLVSEALAHVILFATLPLLVYFELMVTLWSTFSFPVQVASFPLSFSIGYYLLLTAFLVFWHEKAKSRTEKSHKTKQ